MPSELKTCAYSKCELGEDNTRKKFYGTKSAMYCCPKHGTYQRRLKEKNGVVVANADAVDHLKIKHNTVETVVDGIRVITPSFPDLE